MKLFDGYKRRDGNDTRVLLDGGGSSEFVTGLTWDSANRKLKIKKNNAAESSDFITFGSNAFNSTSYLPLSGGTMALGEGLMFSANDNYFGTNADARIISLIDTNGTTCDGGLIINEHCTTDGWKTIYDTELLRIRHNVFTWMGNTIYHAGNLKTMVASGSSHSGGLVPDTPSSAGTAKFLREDGTWSVPAYIADTTYTLSSGDSNGQIKVTPSSGNAYNVAVTGLGSMAYDSGSYVTTNTMQTINAIKNFNTDTDAKPLKISRNGLDQECLSIMVNDYRVLFDFLQDEHDANFVFTGRFDASEPGDGRSGSHTFSFNSSYGGASLYLDDYVVYHAGNLPAYPTKSSWNYDDRYLALSGGTLTNNSSNNFLSLMTSKLYNFISFGASSARKGELGYYHNGPGNVGCMYMQVYNGSSYPTLYISLNGNAYVNDNVIYHAGNFTDYVTRTTAQTITGKKNFSTNTNTVPVIISRDGYEVESVKIGVDDSCVYFLHEQDETRADYSFKSIVYDTESGRLAYTAVNEIRFNMGYGLCQIYNPGETYSSNFYTTSDRSKKKNISSLSKHIRKFTLKENNRDAYGVIAQEVPEMFRDGEEGNMTVNYNSVLSYYIGILENKVESLQNEVDLLKQQLNK